MRLHRMNGSGSGYATFGCMWEKGKCKPGTGFVCIDKDGSPVPIQSRVTAFWPDGSLKWTAHTGAAAQLGDEIEVLPASGNTPATTGISVESCGKGYKITTDKLQINVYGDADTLFDVYSRTGKAYILNAMEELLLEEPQIISGCSAKIEKSYKGLVESVGIEEQGPLQVTVRFQGTHANENGETKLPFIIRMRIGAADSCLHFMHTFIYDGDENKDFLKGIGIAFTTPIEGELYNRHIKFAGDRGVFHEVTSALTSWRPRLPAELYVKQLDGEAIHETGEVLSKIEQVTANEPHWGKYDICQDSAEHYSIKKQLSLQDVCAIDAQHGHRAAGALAFGSEHGSVKAYIRDFWEKYPSGYTVEGLDKAESVCRIWFWHPQANVMDFRHYAERGYNQVCYEGYDYKAAEPVGIACSSECAIEFSEKMIPGDSELIEFAEREREDTRYIASPETYHELGAFGPWSLPVRGTETENWLEDQLEKLFDFYKNEVDQRGWYGMFNYGDFMHSYDAKRHQWKYDVGGYAWDNTELVPTLWLWTYFLRTGRADVFKLAEKLSRHTSEVDIYHLGRFKGLGSRHNVRHWGCPCKEARIAMAHHHRIFYYLTGDLRMAELFEELKDNELGFLNKDPLGDFYDKVKMVYPSHARSGPDWSSLCSNWLTEWERTGNTLYRDKMRIGMNDIASMPLRLISGPDFEFDPYTVHLRYIGERTTGGTHLQICMGAPNIWMEMAELMDDENWRAMMAEYGRFYFLPEEEKQKESGGLIGSREFSLPFMASSMGAYAARYLGDRETAKRTWKVLLRSLIDGTRPEGFSVKQLKDTGNKAELDEIPWISTNFAAQFGINVIMALDMIRDELPKTLSEASELIGGDNAQLFHKA